MCKMPHHQALKQQQQYAAMQGLKAPVSFIHSVIFPAAERATGHGA